MSCMYILPNTIINQFIVKLQIVVETVKQSSICMRSYMGPNPELELIVNSGIGIDNLKKKWNWN